MNCCAAINADTGRFFSRFAGLNRLRFRLFGFEQTQRQLMRGICDGGIEGATLLEIGCGPGYLHRALLRLGASRATGVDLSAGMLAIARAGAQAEGLAERTAYVQGDFTQIADAVPDADVVVLDKVICCYPDWGSLVERSLLKALPSVCLHHPPRSCAHPGRPDGDALGLTGHRLLLSALHPRRRADRRADSCRRISQDL
jgi:2-polyprenyl-3-methyl-5-hydroxy-6-metoxy-1,4-benzoquinol methylase